MLIELDDGFSFGLGLFETILLYKGEAVFLDEHLARINQSIIDLNLNIDKLEKDEVYRCLETNKSELEHEVLKIVLTEKNRLFIKRAYTYTDEDYPIFLNSRSLVTEGATSNIFIIIDNKIYTPKLDSGLLNGIIRQYIISNYPVIETDIDLEFLNKADEIFLTNSLFGVMPVSSLENKKLKSQKISREILSKYLNQK